MNKIYNMDCLEGMKQIADGSVDMILCDLPYGTTQNKWDTIIPLNKLWEQYERVIKFNGAIVLTAAQPFTSLLGFSNVKYLRYSWVWQKNNATGHLNAKRIPMRDYEDVLVFYKKQPTYNPQGIVPYNKITTRGHNGSCYRASARQNLQEFTNYPRMCIAFTRDKESIHPTQKPVALFEYLIKTYTNKGDTVLDNCIGSGTTAVACMNTGRNFIGFELEPKYYNLAIERINNLKQ